MSYRFEAERFFPRRIMDAITETRVQRPEIIVTSAVMRKRRTHAARDGKLNLLACDHPARGVIQSLGNPIGMGNRQEYLGRAVRALLCPDFDGVMAHTDLIEDLLILDYLLQEAGGPSILNDRIVAGSMNRGGVAGVSGEIHDRFTSFTPDSIAALGLDGGKILIRAVSDDERTLMTLAECANAVTALSRHNLLAFLEPVPTKQREGTLTSDPRVEELVRWVGVCAALGETSRNTWLKVPFVPGFHLVTLATTLPILMLGGPAHGDPRVTLEQFAEGMRCGANVRGTMVGRNVLYPGDEDPLGMTAAVTEVVRGGVQPESAVKRVTELRDSDMEALSRYL